MIELQNAQAMMEELGIGPASAKKEDDMAATQELACNPSIDDSPTAEEMIENNYFEETK